MNIKFCSNCGKEKPLGEFYKQKDGKFGVRADCIICRKNYKKVYHRLNKRKLCIKSNKHYKEHPEIREAYYNKTIEYRRRYWLLKRYNITLEQYTQMLIEQNSVCAICGKEEIEIDKRTNKKRNLAVDHNHKTGKVRGLLCSICNTTLGKLKDNIQMFETALKYLKKHNG